MVRAAGTFLLRSRSLTEGLSIAGRDRIQCRFERLADAGTAFQDVPRHRYGLLLGWEGSNLAFNFVNSGICSIVCSAGPRGKYSQAVLKRGKLRQNYGIPGQSIHLASGSGQGRLPVLLKKFR